MLNQYKQILNPRTGQFNLVPSGIIIAFKAGVANYAALPLVGNNLGDARITEDTQHLYMWDGSVWQNQGAFDSIDWSNLTNKPSSSVADIDSAVSLKHTQNTDTNLQFTGGDLIVAQEMIISSDHNDHYDVPNDNNFEAQIFLNHFAGTHPRVTFVCKGKSHTSGITGDNLLIQLQTVGLDGKPTGTVIDSISVAYADIVGGDAENVVEFNNSTSLAASTNYAIVFTLPTLPSLTGTNYQLRTYSLADLYTEGQFAYSTDGLSWDFGGASPYDFTFKVVLNVVVSDLINNGVLEADLSVTPGVKIDGRIISADGTKLDTVESNAASLSTVKADTDVADAIAKKHSNSLDHAQNTDTALGAQSEDLDMNGHSIVNLAPTSISFQGGGSITKTNIDKIHDQNTDTTLLQMTTSFVDILDEATFSSSGAATAYPVGLAHDGNTDSFDMWALDSGVLPCWLQADFGVGNEKVITQLRLFPEKDDGVTRVKDFKLQASNNGSDWTDLLSATHSDTRAFDYWTFANTTAYRYYRVYVLNNYVYENPNIYILEWGLSEAVTVIPLISNGSLENDLEIASGKKIGGNTIEDITDAVSKKHTQGTDSYAASQINNDSSVSGSTVKDALESLIPTPPERLIVEPTSFEAVYYFNGATYTDLTDKAKTNGGILFNILTATPDYFYVGMGGKTFVELFFDIVTAGAGVTLKIEYYNGSIWTDVNLLDDTTANLSAKGSIRWNLDLDWSTIVVNGFAGYFVRLSTTTTPSITPTSYIASPWEYVLGVPAVAGFEYPDYHGISLRANGDTSIEGELKIKVYSQTTEPVLNGNNNMAIWINTSDSNRVYLIFRRGISDQVSVELA